MTILFFTRPRVWVLGLICAIGFLPATASDAATVPEYSNQVIVHFDDSVRAHQQFFGATVTKAAGKPRQVRLPIPAGMSAADYIDRLQQRPGIISVEQDIIRRATFTPDDTYYTEQTYLHTTGIDAETAWDSTTGSSDVVIAIIDSGVDTDHPDLTDNMWVNTGETAGNGIDDDGNGYVDDVYGYDFVDDDGDPNPAPDGIDDDAGVVHGTHVAGIAGAVGNNTLGVSGVSQIASLMAVRALDDEGLGQDSDIAAAVDYAVANGADIISMSLGGYGSTDILETAISDAIAAGTPVIAAAGNDAADINTDVFYPACYDDVIGVGSVDASGAASSFSNYGSNCVDLTAPGENIASTLYTNDATHGFTTDYDYLSGTSMATPVVSGVAALVLTVDTNLTVSELYSVLVGSTDDLDLGAAYGSGRLNAASAISESQDLTGAPTSPTSITAYRSDAKKTTVAQNTRTATTDPYFEWNDASDADGTVAGYYVYFGADESANPVTAGSVQTATNYTASGVTGNDTPYYLRITTVDDGGTTSVSPATFAYLADTVVDPTSSLQLTQASNGIGVHWTTVTDNNVVHYSLLRKKKKSGTFKVIDTIDHPTITATDQTGLPGKTYYYRIRTVDDLGNTAATKTKQSTFYPRDRVVMAPGSGGGPLVRVFNTKSKKYEQSWYAFDKSVGVGVELAVGELDGDRKQEIVAALDAGSEPRVNVFESNGKEEASFLAYASEFNGGVRVGVGDFDNDGVDEIVTAPGPGGGPDIRVYEKSGTLKWNFTAPNSGSSHGWFVTGLQWNGSGRDEIAISGDNGVVYVLSAKGTVLAATQSFSAVPVRLARVSFTDKNNDYLAVAAASGSAQVKHYRKSGSTLKLVTSWSPFSGTPVNGVTVGAGNVSQTGTDRVLVGSTGGTTGTVQVYTLKGKQKQTIHPYGSFMGAVRVASGFVF